MRARVPASSANLGPGFDTLALALALHVEVSVEPAAALEIEATGAGSDLPAGPDHLAAVVVRRVLGHDRVRIEVTSEIPVGRGLGSSAALAAAAAAAAGSVDPLAVAADADGHPENAAASVTGGLVAATVIDGRPVARRLPLDPAIEVVVLIPERALPTSEARQALPAQLPLSDATFNLGRMGLLLAGLADHRQLIGDATADRLHQTHRVPLFPESAGLMKGLTEAGALAACWSGAGPSILALCAPGAGAAVQVAGQELLARHEVAGTARLLPVDSDGLVVSD